MQSSKSTNSRSLLLLTFLQKICSSPFQRIWNKPKFCFFGPHIDLLEKIFFFRYWNHFLYILNAYAQKTEHFFKHFAKSENLLFCQTIILRLEPIEMTKKY
jgi:hypothetical protein